MGSYSYLEVSGYPIWTCKSYVDPEIMTLFREGDKRIYNRKIKDRNPLIWGVDKSNGDETEVTFIYSICAAHAIQRLDIMGFTLSKVKKQFDIGVKARIDDIVGDLYVPRIMRREHEKEVRLLSQYTFEKWKVTFRKIIKDKTVIRTNANKSKISRLIQFVLSNQVFYMGLPFSDIRYFLRAVLEAASPDDNVVLDITDLVGGGYYTGTEELVINAINELSAEFVASSTILILTEGSTDKEVLSQTLSLLYPHLSGYYSFLEFGTSNMEGGAANLVRVVKAFMGSRIVNKVVAVFDNDTAAQVAIKSIQGLAIPENITVIQYPSLSYAENYPTIGPQGINNMNINGLAGSLELYFGEDILKINGRDFTPVQWKGYDDSLGQYQGEIKYKRDLQVSYFKKVNNCRESGDAVSKYDWSAMRSIFEKIFNAFQENR